MGTRHLIGVIADKQWRVAQYGQFDGYPAGQGAAVLRFIRDNDMEEFGRNVRKTREITPEELEAVRVEEDPSFPSLDRRLGAEILNMIQEQKGDVVLRLNPEFAFDSLLCEWAYVINLDTGVLEVYEGFQTEPHEDPENPNAFELYCSDVQKERAIAEIEQYEAISGREYYVVRQVACYPFSIIQSGAVAEMQCGRMFDVKEIMTEDEIKTQKGENS